MEQETGIKEIFFINIIAESPDVLVMEYSLYHKLLQPPYGKETSYAYKLTTKLFNKMAQQTNI